MSCETGGIQKEPNDSWFFTEEQVKALREIFGGKKSDIDVLRAALTPEEFKGFCKGNALKYLIRAGKKDNELQDLKKAGVYIGWCIDAQSTSKSK
jgi:hypothetical protein